MQAWARKFYNSKEWQEVRSLVLRRDNHTCQECGEVIIDMPHVHHKIELTEDNFTDPSISLNPDLLETLHHDCHDVQHGRFGARIKETIVGDDLNIDYTRR